MNRGPTRAGGRHDQGYTDAYRDPTGGADRHITMATTGADGDSALATIKACVVPARR
jgi:hypothetical protein